MMDYTIPNIALEIFSALVALILVICQLTNKDKDTRLSRLFLVALFVHITVLGFDIIAWAFDRAPGAFFHVLTVVANFIVYSGGNLSVAILIAYIAESIPLAKSAKRKVMGVVIGILAVFHVFLILSQFNGMIYSVRDNRFRLGPFYEINYIAAGLLFIVVIFVVLYYRKKLGVRKTLTFMAYVIIPSVTLIINIKFYYLMLLYAGISLAQLVIFVNVQIQREKQMKEQELELMESQVSLMLSQIQPHFLYNSLYSIGKLCDMDAQVAKDAILDFGQYLRGNLDSLTQKKSIPFCEELKHVKNYLSLEQRWFGEKLEVLYDIQIMDFQLPALTLQPLVENAVRHGVAESKQGGTVIIRTEEIEDSWLIAVTDNGAGFDPKQAKKDGRSHIGIENVRNRLKLMCGGSLHIDSTPGEGTSVTVRIPKETD